MENMRIYLNVELRNGGNGVGLFFARTIQMVFQVTERATSASPRLLYRFHVSRASNSFVRRRSSRPLCLLGFKFYDQPNPIGAEAATTS